MKNMDDPDSESIANVQVHLLQARLESQKRLERNTFWTMIAVAGHAGIGVAQAVPAAIAPALILTALALLPLVVMRRA